MDLMTLQTEPSAFPSERDFDGEALDRIAISLISRDGNIIAIDYDTTDLPEGLTKTIHLWAGSKYAIEFALESIKRSN